MSCQSTVYTHGLSRVTCWRLGVNQDNKTSHFKPESYLVFLLSVAGLSVSAFLLIFSQWTHFKQNHKIEINIKTNFVYVNIDRRAIPNDSTCFSAPGAKVILCKPATVKRTMIKRQYFHHQAQKKPKTCLTSMVVISASKKGINKEFCLRYVH